MPSASRPDPRISDPKHWYDRATEMRALAEATKDDRNRAIMLRLADDYDLLGDRAAMLADQSSSKNS
jgi:hypothetical protein